MQLMGLTSKLSGPVKIRKLLAINVSEIIQGWDKVRIHRQSFLVAVACFGEIAHLRIDDSRSQKRRRILRILRQKGIHLLQRLGQLVRLDVNRDKKIVKDGQVRVEFDCFFQRIFGRRKILFHHITSSVNVIGGS